MLAGHDLAAQVCLGRGVAREDGQHLPVHVPASGAARRARFCARRSQSHAPPPSQRDGPGAGRGWGGFAGLEFDLKSVVVPLAAQADDSMVRSSTRAIALDSERHLDSLARLSSSCLPCEAGSLR